MAKVKGPLFSPGAHGTIGDVITFQDGVAGPRAMLVPKHGDAFSTGQSRQRVSFQAAASQWKSLGASAQAAYEATAAGKAMTGYNLYLRDCLLGNVSVVLPSWHYYTYDGQINAGNCDCEMYWNGSAWVFDVTGTGLYFGYGLSSALIKMGSGLCFAALNIPQGATVTAAYLEVKCSASLSQTVVKAKIIGNKEVNPAVWSTIADYKARRGTSVGGADNSKRTTAETLWDNVGAWTLNTWYTSPSIVDVLQELVNQAGFDLAQPLALFLDDHDARGDQHASDYRSYRSYEDGASSAAKLHIEAKLWF